MRIIHLSDVHVWRYAYNPLRLMSKRAIGIASLLAGRASRFRLERLDPVVEHVRSLRADHLLITGDLTTTALPSEFDDALEALAPLLQEPEKVTVIPGNHDRYTSGSLRRGHFEAVFGKFMPEPRFPWLRRLDDRTAILGLDPTRPHLSARGYLPPDQLRAAKALIDNPATRPARLIVACHYPIASPPVYEHELRAKRLINAEAIAGWLGGVGPHLYCCGHVHAAWAFRPGSIGNQLSVNAGAPLLRDPTGLRPPGFLEIELHGGDVSIVHHAWSGEAWTERPIYQNPAFFPLEASEPSPA